MASEDTHLLERRLNSFNGCKNKIIKLTEIRQQLVGQLKENAIVKEELAILKPTGEVFKMVGPVLLRQDHKEAKKNVDKRITYINNELKKIDVQLQSLEIEQDEHRENLYQLQQQYKAQQEKK